MADYEVAECGTTFYVYRGGRAPTDVSHVKIHKSIFAIDDEAFMNCRQLEYVESHKELSKIGKRSFGSCQLLRSIDLSGVKIIDDSAFHNCVSIDADLPEVERIGNQAFDYCMSLTKISAPSAESIGHGAFLNCGRLISAEFGERLHTIGHWAFSNCPSLRHIAVPLPLRRREIFRGDDVFNSPNLSTVQLVGKINNSVKYITMAIWRNQMRNTINQINLDLPATHEDDKTAAIRRWIEEVQDKIIHFKILHSMWLTRATTIFELVLWKVKLEETEDDALECKSKKAKINDGGSMGLSTNATTTREYRYRQEKRIQCGADIIIKNVVSFLRLSRSDDSF